MNSKRVFAMMISTVLTVFGMATAQASSWADADSDYARIGVPDVVQAVAFFENVMGCAPLSAETSNTSSALLECANDRVLELIHAPKTDGTRAAPVRFRSANLASASAALHSHHLHTVDHASPRGVEAVEFATPWGQRIELVGRSPAARSISTASGIASD